MGLNWGARMEILRCCWNKSEQKRKLFCGIECAGLDFPVVAMGSVMLAVFVLEGITAIVASALCCHAVCCCRGSQVSSYYVIQMTNFNKKLALSALIF